MDTDAKCVTFVVRIHFDASTLIALLIKLPLELEICFRHDGYG